MRVVGECTGIDADRILMAKPASSMCLDAVGPTFVSVSAAQWLIMRIIDTQEPS